MAKAKPKTQPQNSDLSTSLAVLAGRVDANHEALCQQFADGMTLVLEKLKPIEALKKELDEQIVVIGKHDRQINFWRGAIVVLGMLWTVVTGTAITWGAVVLRRGH